MNDRIDRSMKDAVQAGVFPAADLLVAKGGEVVHHSYHGDAREGTAFDIASLTKPISTATLTMLLASEGKIDPQGKLIDWFDHASMPHYDEITISMLMNHVAGFPWWKPFYRELPSSLVGTPEGKEHIIDACLREELEHAPGSTTVYSDLGFILLGSIIEKAANLPLDELFAKRVAEPLNIKDTFFVRNEGMKPSTTSRRTDTTAGQHVPTRTSVSSKEGFRRRIAATEDCPWRNCVVHGEVHDQNTYAMGGVAGQGGLFSTALDIHRFIAPFMRSFSKKEEGLIPHDTIERFFPIENGLIAPPSPGTFVGGWDTPSASNSASGHYSSRHAIGHLAYTGCSIWIDQMQDFWIVLLTNRIHPQATNEKIKAFRPQIHDLIYNTLIAE
jgi:CubicO group peptidase (beta-lactamase class C family)